MKPKDINYVSSSVSIFPDSLKSKLVKHLNNGRVRSLNLSDEDIKKLCNVMPDAYGWRQIGNEADNKRKITKPHGRKSEREQLKKLQSALKKFNEALNSLSVDDEHLLDDYFYSATKLHLEPINKEDSSSTLDNKRILQKSAPITLESFLEIHNSVIGRGKVALIAKQIELALTYWSRRLDAITTSKKLRKYYTEVGYLASTFKSVFPNRNVSANEESLFCKYVTFYLTEYYKHEQGKYPNVQASTVIKNFLSDQQLIKSSPNDPTGLYKRLIDSYKK